jgi:hypothetical protein
MHPESNFELYSFGGVIASSTCVSPHSSYRFKQINAPMNLILLTCLFITTAAVLPVSTPQMSAPQNKITMENSSADSIAISTTLETYFKAIYEGAVALLGSTFNKGTLLFGDVKGQPYAKTLDEYLDGVKNRKSPKDSGQPFKGEIISIHVINSIAVANVKVKMYAFNYDELLSFHKIDNKWLIVNKMITDISQ